MATGHDARQVTRQSFAFQGAQPRQARQAATGASRGAQIVGGESRGEAIAAGPQTNPGASAGQLGAYFEKLMQPHIERKQQQKFFEGFAAAQEGQAIEELSQSHRRVDGIFGPTGFEQGAQFYTAMTAVDTWQTQMLQRSDELMKLDPKEQAKIMADTSQEMMTGDPYVNQIVQAKLIEQTGPLLATVAKKRYAWQQGAARDATFGSWSASATALQNLAQQEGDLTDASDPRTVAFTNQLSGMVQGMAKPHGMADDTYRGLLTDFLVSSSQQGNFYAYEALTQQGVLKHLPPDDQKKVEDAYERYSRVGLERAKGDHVEDLLRIQEQMEKREISPLQAVAAVDKINDTITRKTGIKGRAYDSAFLNQTGKSVIDMIAADARREEDRQYQARVRATERALDAADEAAEAEAIASGARQSLAMGKPRSYLLADGDAGALGIVAKDVYDRGDFGTLSKAYKTEQWVAPALPAIMQAKLTSAAGQSFTADAQTGYAEWQALYQTDNGATAAAYYGPEHIRLLNMQRLINAGEPAATAYVRAFATADKAKYSGLTLRAKDRRETTEAVAAFVAGKQTSRIGNFLGISRRPMNKSTIEVFTNVVSESVALGQQNSDLTQEHLIEQYGQAAVANNSFEGYGAFGWRNASGTKPLHQILSVPAETFDDILYDELDERLKAAGYADGAHGDNYDIIRSTLNGKVRLNVFEPGGKMVSITEDELRKRKDDYAREQRTSKPWRETPFYQRNAK